MGSQAQQLFSCPWEEGEADKGPRKSQEKTETSWRKGRPWKALNPATSAPPGIRFQHPTDGPRAPLQLLHRRPPVQRGWPTGCSDHHPNPALLVLSPDHQLHLMENLPPVVPGHPAPPAIHMRGPGAAGCNHQPCRSRKPIQQPP
ncbi:uncharacterized protein [Bos mutus]|uniref:uncharacterized protein isoform X2 n=1 Tax=Bos mutus TaxID=72004 RepID=UPI0038B5E66D